MKKQELKTNGVYNIGLGFSEPIAGIYLGSNKRETRKVLVRSTERDRGESGKPRIYNFTDYKFEKGVLRIPSPAPARKINESELVVLTNLLASRGL